MFLKELLFNHHETYQEPKNEPFSTALNGVLLTS